MAYDTEVQKTKWHWHRKILSTTIYLFILTMFLIILSLIKHNIGLSSSWDSSRWGCLLCITAMPSKDPLQLAQPFRHKKMTTAMAHWLLRWTGYPRDDPTTHSYNTATSYWDWFCFWTRSNLLAWTSVSVWRVVVTQPSFCNPPVHLQSPGDLTIRNMWIGFQKDKRHPHPVWLGIASSCRFKHLETLVSAITTRNPTNKPIMRIRVHLYNKQWLWDLR